MQSCWDGRCEWCSFSKAVPVCHSWKSGPKTFPASNGNLGLEPDLLWPSLLRYIRKATLHVNLATNPGALSRV